MTDRTKDNDEALEIPRRSFTRFQAKELSRLFGFQWEIKKMLIVEEELKTQGDDWQVQQLFYGPN